MTQALKYAKASETKITHKKFIVNIVLHNNAGADTGEMQPSNM